MPRLAEKYFLVLSLLLSLCSCDSARVEEYQLIRVIDGDSIVVSKLAANGTLTQKSKSQQCQNLANAKNQTWVENLHRVVKDCGYQEVRLLDMDAPEYGQEPWGPKSAAFLETVLKSSNSKKITLEFGLEKTDKYGRLLAYVYNSDAELANEKSLANGHSLVYSLNSNNRHILKLKEAEASARKQQIEIWDPLTGLKEKPYEYRKKQKAKRK